MKTTVGTIAAVACACALSGSAAAAERHVDADAKTDAPDGTTGAPFATIGAALQKAAPGDTVTVHAGTYAESIRIPGGAPGKPVTLRAAPGLRPVVTGARPVTGWQPGRDGVYTAAVDVKPDRLLLDGRPLPPARLPAEGWWRAEKAAGTKIVDAKHLKGLAIDPAGGEASIWAGHGNTFFTVPVESLDRRTGTLRVTRMSKWMKLRDGDRYYLKNHPGLIAGPGQWAVRKDGTGYRIYVKPEKEDHLRRITAPRETRRVVGVFGGGHVRIAGLEITGAANNGIAVKGCRNVEITGCVARGNGGTGIAARDVAELTIRRCISRENYCGVTLHSARQTTVEQCEIARNGMDGLVVSWQSSDVTVRHNYIHHHLLWGHPDNMQMYRGVRDVRVIDNLLVAGGQSIMMEEVAGGLFRGNMIVGSGATSLIFGHENAGDCRVLNNTVAFAGYGCLRLTAEKYDVRENVLVTGNAGCILAAREADGYRGDRNLLFNAAGLARACVATSAKGWHSDLGAFRKATGQDAGSRYADPAFRSAPVAYGVVDARRLTDCTRATLHLRPKSGPFAAGDTVEIDFDGVPRTVVSIAERTITIAPPLETLPVKGPLVCNWGKAEQCDLDLRLAENSPGARLSATGGPVGSTVDIAAYRRGDFDGDGTRDLPAVDTGR